jgi:hypothetical protein
MLAVAVVALLIWGAGDPTMTHSVDAAYGPQLADYHATMARKHRRAMWHPWTPPLVPDPPAPVIR